ncbi:MAG: dihydropteroate synthase [Armatimonadota bacterium]
MSSSEVLGLLSSSRETARTLVMGILNVTPDSFSDGGLYLDAKLAVEHALQMLRDGADIIDVGGESTRPGAQPVPADEEMRRVLPVIERLAEETNAPISIDTYKSSVAREALKAGACIVNDISGLRFDSEIAAIAAESGAYLIVMHSIHTPATMQVNPQYDDVVAEVREFLKRQSEEAQRRGVPRDRIIVDPGIGFGKTVEHNLELLRRLPELVQLGYPVLVGVSRKSFIGAVLEGAPPSERLEGTLAAVTLSIAWGARIVRVHDVAPTVKAARVADAILFRPLACP